MNKKKTSIKFAAELIPLILQGSKTITYRVGNDFDFLIPGDILPVKESATGKPITNVIIVEKSYTTFKKLPIKRKGHEVYKSKKEQRETFKKYYGRAINDEEKILVLHFEVIKK